MTSTSRSVSPLRRGLLKAAGAALIPWAGAAKQASAQGSAPAQGSRLALLIGNRDYPGGEDLPSMHTNVRRLQAALQGVGFDVTSLFDQDRAGSLQAVENYARRLQRMPADGVSLYYFCGHGMQIDAENFLLPSHVLPREHRIEESRKLYVELWRQVIEQLPQRPDGLTITVIDACRSSPRPLKADGLNQVRARPGEMVVFSTGAGRPALAPINENQLTFFTSALVRRLERLAGAHEELTFASLFRAVGTEVERTMTGDPDEDIRAFAQKPFIADHTGRPVRVALPTLGRPMPGPGVGDDRRRAADEEQAAFDALQQALWPRDVVRLAQEFVRRFPGGGRFLGEVEVAGNGAAAAASVLSSTGIGLQARDFQRRPDLGDAYNEDLRRAARGDKDAAARLAAWLEPGTSDGPAALRYEGWLQYAGTLGNGIASYDLSEYYNKRHRPGPAGIWATRARQSGYTPPPSLRSTR